MDYKYQVVNTKTGSTNMYSFANDKLASNWIKTSTYFPDYVSIINITTGTVLHKATKSEFQDNKEPFQANNNTTIMIVVAIVIIIAIAYFAMKK